MGKILGNFVFGTLFNVVKKDGEHFGENPKSAPNPFDKELRFKFIEINLYSDEMYIVNPRVASKKMS